MKFVDEATVRVKAGDGGNGCLSFRRENTLNAAAPMAVTAGTVVTFTWLRTTRSTRWSIFGLHGNIGRKAGRVAPVVT